MNLTDDEVSSLVVGAFRYNLGRMTYSVSYFCDLVVRNKEDIPKGVLDLIEAELKEAIKDDDLGRKEGKTHYKLGMDVDRIAWTNLYLKLRDNK